MRGEFREVSAPRRLSFTWGEDELSFELEERDGGAACRLSFEVVLDAAGKAARDAAGWDDCLDMLAIVVSGEAPARPSESAGWRARYDQYKGRGFPADAPLPQ
jgi:Activator of Hsp90 ATPase homolog 1-like protein